MGADPPGRPMRSRLWPGATSNVARRAPPRHQSGCPAPGRTCRHGQSTPAKGCLAPTLPGALPAGAPCHNVGTWMPLVRLVQGDFNALSPRRAPRGCPLRQCWDSTGGAAPLPSLPTLSKTAPRRRRCRRSANRFGRLTPEVVFSQRSAASMSRRHRYEGREGLPGGACQRARWRSIAGRSRTPESDLEVGRGRKPKPVQRRRRCRRMHPASDCADPAMRIAPKVSLSVQYEPESRSHRSRDHGDDDEGEHAARGAALGAINTNRGVCGNRAARRPPQAGVIWSGGRRRMLAFGDDRHDKSCSRRQPRALGSSGRLPTPLPLRRRARTARA